MNQLQVFISGLILLLPVTGAVDSYTSVQGQVGHPVTLPCNYSTSRDGPVPSCWGRGECRYSYCISSLIWTNGYKVTYQRKNRYQLKGNISEGNVSLTIENTDMSDGGRYCCVVEIPGVFYFGDYLLEVKQENTKSPPTRPKTTRPTTTGRPTTISTRSTQEPTSTRVSASTPPTTTHTPTHKRVTGAVDSYTSVQGQVGHPVTLPCNYSTSLNRPVPSCWGQGECRSSYCITSLIWTNGYNVTYQRRNRYQLKGNISEGNVSLTIENMDMSDGGRYCCVVEIPGAFYFGDYLLEVKRDNISSTTFHPNETTAEVTEAPVHSPADWNNTVTSSDDSWNTEAIPPRKLQKNQTQGFYVGIFIAALLLLLLVGSVVITRRTVMKRKCSLRLADFPVSKFGAYQKKVVEQARGKDKIYIVEDTPNPEEVLVAL